MGAVDQIRIRRGWKHRKWRKAMMDLCRKVARDDGFYVKRIPMHSALICIRDIERVNGTEFDPFDTYHAWKVLCYARHSRLGACLRYRRRGWAKADDGPCATCDGKGGLTPYTTNGKRHALYPWEALSEPCEVCSGTGRLNHA